MENEKPEISEQAANFIKSMTNWAVKDGFHTVPSDILEKRKDICTKCEFWDFSGFGGLGMCKKCGCSAGKLYIPSSKCPLSPPKWEAFIFSDTLGKP